MGVTQLTLYMVKNGKDSMCLVAATAYRAAVIEILCTFNA